MTKRKNHLPEFKAKVALDAICEEMTMAEIEISVLSRQCLKRDMSTQQRPDLYI